MGVKNWLNMLVGRKNWPVHDEEDKHSEPDEIITNKGYAYRCYVCQQHYIASQISRTINGVTSPTGKRIFVCVWCDALMEESKINFDTEENLAKLRNLRKLMLLVGIKPGDGDEYY